MCQCVPHTRNCIYLPDHNVIECICNRTRRKMRQSAIFSYVYYLVGSTWMKSVTGEHLKEIVTLKNIIIIF